jgi:hypothetical protein
MLLTSWLKSAGWLGYRAGNWLGELLINYVFIVMCLWRPWLPAAHVPLAKVSVNLEARNINHDAPLFSPYSPHSMMAEMNFKPMQKCPLGRGSQ